MEERMIAALEEIAKELRALRINSSIIAHALSGSVEEQSETVAESLTKIGKSIQIVAEFTEASAYSVADVAAQVKGISDAVGETNENRETYSITESLAGIDQSLRSIDASSETAIAEAILKAKD